MSSDFDNPTTRYAEKGGVTAAHPSAVEGPFLVAPSTGEELNTLRIPLLPIACWRLNAGRFDFDSSFVLPTAQSELAQLSALVASRKGAPASIFGHADPTGEDEYNKKLSGRRALSLYGLLTRDTALWEKLYVSGLPGDRWGTRSIQRMLGHVQDPGGAPYYAGSADGSQGPATTAAITRFQKDNGLKADGIAGPVTRASLFLAYMDALCGDFVMTPGDFLGKGDAGLKASCQGCGEFNPVKLIELAGNKDTESRNERNAPNRRVVIYFFRPGTTLPLGKWPCPTVEEGGAGCRSRFWADGEARRQQGGAEREYRNTKDTFACRFYDGLSRWSPCEGVVVRTIRIRLFDQMNRPLPRARFLARFAGREERGEADGSGFVVLRRIVPPTKIHLQWRAEPPEDDPTKDDPDERLFEHRKEIFVTPGDHDADDAVQQRLHNLGFVGADTLEGNVRAFQRAYGLPETGVAADIEAPLIAVHESGSPKEDTAGRRPRIDNNP